MSFGNRKQVERKLKERCRVDRARIQIGRITNFGLLEMSRQRLRESNVKWNIQLTDESFANKIIKLAEIKSITNKSKKINITVNEKIKNFINSKCTDKIKYFEKKNKLKMEVTSDHLISFSDYKIEFLSTTKKVIEKIENIHLINNDKIPSERIFKKEKKNKLKDLVRKKNLRRLKLNL